jgi:hypothetical protein
MSNYYAISQYIKVYGHFYLMNDEVCILFMSDVSVWCSFMYKIGKTIQCLNHSDWNRPCENSKIEYCIKIKENRVMLQYVT